MKSPVNTFAFQEYQKKRQLFTNKFSSQDAWGDWVSQQRVSTFSEILNYFEETDEIGEHDASLQDLIISDNVNILIAMPGELKESMAVSSNSLPWSNSSRRVQFGCLLLKFKALRISMTLLIP